MKMFKINQATLYKVEWIEGGVLHSIGGFSEYRDALRHAESIGLDENFVSVEESSNA